MAEERMYYSYSEYLKEKYGEKVYKLPVNLPVSCPNRREGRGCTFCAEEGTGFESADARISVREQLRSSREKVEKRYHAKKYIAYFQNYTNTFLPLPELLGYLEEAAREENVVEVCLSTRPDCVRRDYLDAMAVFREKSGMEVSLELGLQTVNYHTLRAVNRGHGLAEFLDAVLAIAPYGFPVCVHMILNLPGDTMEDARESARVLSALPVSMVKLHSLYIPKKSVLYQEYRNGRISVCAKEEYLERLAEFIALLRPDIAVERLFARIPEKDSAFCNWGCSWWKLMDEWKALMEEKNYVQGIHCQYLNGAALNRWGL
ncbi:MAG TPA: TIGR01212 family radical SAM protein [Candidatus Anaerobutyricum avicola]|nr:TIGR01212 family radical SAM protein [Candidatus Anaerobutyricum avicola]